MKKFLLLWAVICLIVIFLPKLLDRFTPKTVIKEVPIYKIKEVIKEIEKPVFKGERIVEKQVIVYTGKRLDLFIIHQIDEDTFVINLDDKFPNTVWELSMANDKQQGILLHRKREFLQNSVSMSTVDFIR